MTTKELKDKIIRSCEKDGGKIFDLIINFEGKIRNDEIETCIDGAISNIEELANGFVDNKAIKVLQQEREIYWKEVINDVIDRLRDFIATKEEREDRKND